MADSPDSKALFQARRKEALEQARRAVPDVQVMDGVPNLVTRKVFFQIMGKPIDLKAIALGLLAGLGVFFVLLDATESPWWFLFPVTILVVVKVAMDFAQGDGVITKPPKPQRKASDRIADQVRMGPFEPDEKRLLVVSGGREVGYDRWFEDEMGAISRNLPLPLAGEGGDPFWTPGEDGPFKGA